MSVEEWDDAVHVAAPWARRSSLCGGWNRNLVALDDPRPDGTAGCWTCLMAAEWIDALRAVYAGTASTDQYPKSGLGGG